MLTHKKEKKTDLFVGYDLVLVPENVI